jgi:hypothetical protein
MKPQNQVTVRSSETGLVFRINRRVAEKHDTLTILDDETTPKAAPKGSAPVKSAKKADPIAAPVADDNQ